MFYGQHKLDGSYGFFDQEMVDKGFCINPIELDDEYYRSLLKGQEQGLEIQRGEDGMPIAAPHVVTQEEKASMVRYTRDKALKASDIEVLPDKWNAKTDEEKQAWTDYRQYLRDIPQGEDFPEVEVLTFEQYSLQK